MNRTIKRLLNILLIFSLMIFTGCVSKTVSQSRQGQTEARQNKITVCTSFYTMQDFAKKIGRDKIELINLVPVGTEPHDWEPTPRDIANIEKADVLIYNGAGMEEWVEKVLKSINNQKIIVVEAAKAIKLMEHQDRHYEKQQNNQSDEAKEGKNNSEFDPHVWLNPQNAKVQMKEIKDAFVKADPSNADYYQANFSEIEKKLDQLDNEYKECISRFSKKDIVVAHEAYGYLCSTYGLNQIGIEGLGGESDPSPARMGEIIKFIKDNNVKVIFAEELINPKVVNAIARDAGAGVLVLNPLEGLKDEDIRSGKEYFSVMRENLSALKSALEG